MRFKITKQDFIFISAIAAMFVCDRVIGCPTQFLTGLSCPGCGMTRAAISLINLNFSKAYYYNPCVYELPFAVLLYIFRNRLKNVKFKMFSAFILLSVYISVYIYRMYSGHEVLNNDISSGIIYKFLFSI